MAAGVHQRRKQSAEDAKDRTEVVEVMHENEISKIIIGCAMKVHTKLGPLETVCRRLLEGAAEPDQDIQ